MGKRRRTKKNLVAGYDVDDPAQKQALVAQLAEAARAGISMKEALQIPDRQLENVYSIAYHNYQQGSYKVAASLFQYLLTFDQNVYKYWLGLAACHHKMHDYAAAARLYQMASLHNPADPIPFFHAAHCFLHIGNTSLALTGLEMAIRIGTVNAKYEELKERAILLKNKILASAPH